MTLLQRSTTLRLGSLVTTPTESLCLAPTVWITSQEVSTQSSSQNLGLRIKRRTMCICSMPLFAPQKELSAAFWKTIRQRRVLEFPRFWCHSWELTLCLMPIRILRKSTNKIINYNSLLNCLLFFNYALQ